MKYIATNHNDVPLCEPTTKVRAQQEGEDYQWATGNAFKIKECHEVYEHEDHAKRKALGTRDHKALAMAIKAKARSKLI